MNGKYLYPHVPANSYIFKHTFEVPAKENQELFKLEEKSAVEHKRIIGMWVAPPGGKGFAGADIVSDTIFNASYITLQQQETSVAKYIPLRQIKQCNDNGLPYYIDMGEVDMVESSIKIGDQAALPRAEDNFVFQFTFDFTKPKKRK